MTSVVILDKYKNGIKEIIIDINGSKIDSIKFNDLEIDINKANGNTNYLYNENKYLPIFKSSKPEAYIIPITGKGLWSTLYGYFAIDNDLNTVKGITFYKHGETPGLGAEIEKEWFQENFIGKKIKNNSNELVSIEVLKGKSDGDIHSVDGISGATITCRGVTDMLMNDISKYNSFFDNLLSEGN